MVENRDNRVTISFECPVCTEHVEMIETDSHNLTLHEKNHKPTFSGKPKKDCPVYFGADERKVRRKYDFITYDIPTVFIRIPEQTTDPEVLEAAITSAEEQSFGIALRVSIQDRDGNRQGEGYVYAWYHGNNPSYYAVTVGIRTPHNVIVTESSTEFEDFLDKWFYWNRELERPDSSGKDGRSETREDKSLDEF